MRYARRMATDPAEILGSIRVDRFADAPMYRQLANWFRHAIEEGELKAPAALPSEGQIAAALDVSKTTVREALDLLVAEGLVLRRAGTATRVAPPVPVRQMDAARYIHAITELREHGEHPARSSFTEDHGIDWDKFRVDFTVSKDRARAKDAELLGVEVGSPILRRVSIKYADGVPVQLQRSAMRWEDAGATELADPGRQPWPGGTIAELWHIGFEWTKTVDIEGARLPDDDERRQLHMETPAPVLDVERVFWAKPIGGSDDESRPLEASRVIMDARRARLRHETTAR